MVAPAEKPVKVENAVCPRCEQPLWMVPGRPLPQCRTPGCPGPRLCAVTLLPEFWAGKPARRPLSS